MDWWFGMIGMTGGLICGIQQLAEWFGMIVYVFSQNPVGEMSTTRRCMPRSESRFGISAP